MRHRDHLLPWAVGFLAPINRSLEPSLRTSGCRLHSVRDVEMECAGILLSQVGLRDMALAS